MIQQRNSVRLSMCYNNISFTREQLALLEDRDQTIGDLQFSLDEKDAQLEPGGEIGRERERGAGERTSWVEFVTILIILDTTSKK